MARLRRATKCPCPNLADYSYTINAIPEFVKLKAIGDFGNVTMVRQLPQAQSNSAKGYLPSLESVVPEGISYAARLTRPEFEWCYVAATDIKKAELIQGIVYVASLLCFQQYAEPHRRRTRAIAVEK
ncbi:MAG: hypothetical protein HC840_13305 [Leptolyngbyaceae cyanobacterium RM2_2_4]|nr:hypothetical protein [Leptolyngbyaceae cyanobacterium SM1_4_3]NJN91187.1 hypothetical protein [Leptolyngbyaceae cyanobacterium SL_5_14]NJO50246.1 hypothetical protein [Leptolyngbyaceae cyanobacterium RM2_2_4]